MTPEKNTHTSETSELNARKADMIDQHVGKKLREHRRMLDMSQQDVSDLLSISYQQIQKYESGVNRISAGRLYTLAQIMQIPVSKFYEGLQEHPYTDAENSQYSSSLHTRELVTTPEVKQALYNLADTIKRHIK
ncbi:helix-turn-helix domain-containing protein [Kordiimonas sp. SCSIO 12610]|uniref:helix-turn-helix domain-containing protein n=1 Tax=Kordiimonas sp. SCSIO 12610 TaxID=2829597 RepID=UPI0021093E53|nr:helix-turn-helix transcriptional regulator [Kordiimonas sp. SCSIO 12610]UTW54447.1 helix-turn-helix transcriptional regulator [Kordiimonas sp. SCSIO 12610]